MRRKPRSPFRGASRNDIAELRALIVSQLAWERALGTPSQYLQPDRDGIDLEQIPYRSITRVTDRSRERWERAPHFSQSYSLWCDQVLKHENRTAWEAKQLREEVAGLRAEVAQLREGRAQ